MHHQEALSRALAALSERCHTADPSQQTVLLDAMHSLLDALDGMDGELL